MKSKMGVSLLGAAVVVCSACGDNKVVPVPQLAPGHLNVAGSIHAQSPHYRLMTTTGAAGGPRAAQGTRSHDGIVINGQN
jgi:hypothetical protein